jgi:hypothetical protein
MTFIIEKNVPVQSDRQTHANSGYKTPDFPFSRMDVGDSFLFYPEDCEGASLIVCQNIASSAASKFVKGSNWKFTTRQIGGNFVRVWRVS